MILVCFFWINIVLTLSKINILINIFNFTHDFFFLFSHPLFSIKLIFIFDEAPSTFSRAHFLLLRIDVLLSKNQEKRSTPSKKSIKSLPTPHSLLLTLYPLYNREYTYTLLKEGYRVLFNKEWGVGVEVLFNKDTTNRLDV